MDNKDLHRNEKFLYKDTPTVFLSKDVDRFLEYCYDIGASDITIKSEDVIWVEIHGKFFPVTSRKISKSEASTFVQRVTQSEAVIALLNSGEFYDCSYVIKKIINNSQKVIRFRVNVISILTESILGYEITMRTIDSIPKKLSDMKLEPEIRANIAPTKGMVLVCGATGSGKSTLLSSVIRDLLEEEDGNRKIITYENPIEFVYDEVFKPSSIISQSEIPKNVKNFAEALKSALRRKPNVILIGEMRDKETISEGVIASMTGHLLYSTLHSNGVADTVRRMVGVFPTEEKNSAAIDILSSLKMIVSQMLIPSTDGKRVAIREYLVFTEEIVNDLFLAGPENLAKESRKMLIKHGRTYLQDATEKFNEGRISQYEFNKIKALSDGEDKNLNLNLITDTNNNNNLGNNNNARLESNNQPNREVHRNQSNSSQIITNGDNIPVNNDNGDSFFDNL